MTMLNEDGLEKASEAIDGRFPEQPLTANEVAEVAIKAYIRAVHPIPIKDERAVRLIQEIGKVRAWITGFKASGNRNGPPGEDCLRQIQILLRETLSKRCPIDPMFRDEE